MYNLQILHTATLAACHGCKTDVHHDSGPTNTEKQEFFHKYRIEGYILLLRYMYMYLLYQGVYTLQILHIVSLVGQN